MHKRGAHAASRSELIRAVHVRCSQRPSCRQTTRHTATQWLICPMKNEQAGLQSALCAPLTVPTSSHSLAVCPFLTMWPSLSLFYHIPFFCLFLFLCSFLFLLTPVTFLSARGPKFLSPARHLAPSILLSAAATSVCD